MTKARHTVTGLTWEEDQIGHIGRAALLDGCLCNWAKGSTAGQVARPRDAAVHHALPPVNHDHACAAGTRLQGRPHPAGESSMLWVLLGRSGGPATKGICAFGQRQASHVCTQSSEMACRVIVWSFKLLNGGGCAD